MTINGRLLSAVAIFRPKISILAQISTIFEIMWNKI